jgi:hypothetical protein
MKRGAIKVGSKIVKLSTYEMQLAHRLERQVTNSCQHLFAGRPGMNRQVLNELGTLVDITTLTTILKSITEQKFYTIPVAQYIPVKVGEGAWSQYLMGYRSFDVAAPFADGVLDTGADNTRLASTDAAVDAITTPVFNWAKSIGWSIIDLYQAARAGNWDLISAKEKARVRNWQLGIQYVAFLGLPGRNGVGGNCFGLLNQPGIESNTTIIDEPISDMDPTEFNAFVKAVIEDYRLYSRRTAYPNRFMLPESDFNGLASQVSPEFPLRTKISLLEEAFKLITKDPGFEILPLAYGDAAEHADIPQIAGKQIYVLTRYDEETAVMNIPVDYTNTMQNTINGFQFQSVGYGQFTGVQTYRPREIRYYTHTAS